MNFPFLCRLLREESPAPAFWAEYKISPLSVRIFAGQPVQVGYHSPPFRAGVGANTDPRRPLQGQAQAAPRFLRDAAHFPPASKPQPDGRRFTARRRPLQREGAAGVSPCGRNRRRSRRARPPCGGRAACGASRRVCTRPGSQPLPQQPQKLRLGHFSQGAVTDLVRQHHRQLLALPLFIRP